MTVASVTREHHHHVGYAAAAEPIVQCLTHAMGHRRNHADTGRHGSAPSDGDLALLRHQGAAAAHHVKLRASRNLPHRFKKLLVEGAAKPVLAAEQNQPMYRGTVAPAP